MSTQRYQEEHELTNLKVVFLDQHSLHEALSHQASGEEGAFPVYPLMSGTMSAKLVKGFFDFNTNTLFCSKWDYEVCGHELHHAVFGQFHSPH